MQSAQLDPQTNQPDNPNDPQSGSFVSPFQPAPTALHRDAQPLPTGNNPVTAQDDALPPMPTWQTQASTTDPDFQQETPGDDQGVQTPPAPIGNLNKEAGVFGSESVPLVELSEAEIAPETEGWIEKVPKPENVTLEQPVVHEEEVLVAEPSTPVIDEKLVLPMTQAAVQVGITKKVTESARWLAEWCVRIVKMMGGKAAYQPEPMHQGYEKGTNHEPQ